MRRDRRARHGWWRITGAACAWVTPFALLAGFAWWWFFSLPPERCILPSLNAALDESRGERDFDSDDNAFLRYRALFRETLGLRESQGGAQIANAGNELYEAWVNAQFVWSGVDPILSDWDDPLLEQGKKSLTDLAPLLEALDLAASAPWYLARYVSAHDPFVLEPEEGVQGQPPATLPHLPAYIALGTLNRVAMRDAAHRGDWDEFLRRVRTGISHARLVAQDAYLVSAHAALSIEWATLSELRFTLLEHRLSPDSLDALRHEIESRGEGHDMRTALRTERVRFPSMVREDVEYYTNSAPPWRWDFWGGRLQIPPARLAMRDADRYFSTVETRAAMTPALRAVAPHTEWGTAGWYAGFSDYSLGQRDQHARLRAGTLIMIDIERFRAANARLPRSLDETGDAIDPVTLTPFVYEPCESGASYTLRAPPPPSRGVRDLPFALTIARGEKP